MKSMSRRSFLTRSSLGAVGAVGVLSAGPAGLAVLSANESPLTADEIDTLSGPLVVQVRDAVTGEIEVMVNEASVVFRDQALVAKVIRAAK